MPKVIKIKMKSKSLLYILLVQVIFFLLTSCRNENKPDISEIQTSIEIKRLDQDLFASIPDDTIEFISSLEYKYGKFFDLYNYRIISIGDSEEKLYIKNLLGFTNDPVIKQILEKCQIVFPQINEIQDGLNQGFRYYLYYYPDKPVPEVYTYLSGFNQSVITDERMLGIGLDKYLGADCDFYDRLAIPAYARRNMYPAKIVSDCMMAWALMEFDSGRPDYIREEIEDNLINNMLYNGKIMYFLDAVLPNEEESIKIGFSSQQLEWCINNEANMWDYLIENELIFSTDLMTMKKLLNKAPYTSYFTDESPGRSGIWIGWQIIRSYMKKTGISLQELMADNNYRKILNESGYNPG